MTIDSRIASNQAPIEPGTAHALWPTFLRRTLSEEALYGPRTQERLRGPGRGQAERWDDEARAPGQGP
jgi:hypothetical protein